VKMCSLNGEDDDVMMTSVKTELLDTDEERASSAADAASDGTTASDADGDTGLSQNDTSSSGAVRSDAAESIKTENIDKILDLSRDAATTTATAAADDDDDDDDSADGIRYLFIHYRHRVILCLFK